MKREVELEISWDYNIKSCRCYVKSLDIVLQEMVGQRVIER